MTSSENLLKTPLYDLHLARGGRMVPFAGYAMPVNYALGVMKEHLHTRDHAGLFDVSHMGIARLQGPDAIAAMEALAPTDIQGLKEGQISYSILTNTQGGILDDLMITREEDGLFLVINAACKDSDIAHLRANLTGDVDLVVEEDYALIALQGPKAVEVLSKFNDAVEQLVFMTSGRFDLAGQDCVVSRSGYTGEDGFEIFVPQGAKAEGLVEALLAQEDVALIGLGARDSLRLEAGLCLYGQDIDETTTAAEAGLQWAVHKARRVSGGFPGDDVILAQLAQGPSRQRVGILPEGRTLLRAGVVLKSQEGEVIGKVTSGGFGPSVGCPVAMAYVAAAFKKPDTQLAAEVRGKDIPCRVVNMPFKKKNYYRE